jgi:FdhE protein
MAIAPPAARLADLARSRADWQPWLSVLDAVHAGTRDVAWRGAVPEAPASVDARMPLLAGGTLTVQARLLRRWTGTLLRAAAAGGGAADTLTAAAGAEAARLAALLEAGLAQDGARVADVAASLGVDAGALGAVAAVAPIPLLRACAERWASHLPASWDHGYCPVCGAWPAFAEARGLERARRLRCGRCAADWGTAWLRCPYCGTDEYPRLGSLVLTTDAGSDARPELARVATTVETCHACRGYLKTVTTLTPTPADDLALLDLATVELDVAAIEHGYARPAGPGAPLGARVVTPAGGRLAGWWRS